MSDKKVNPIPDGYPRFIPFLIVNDAPKLIDFITGVFGAELTDRVDMPDGKVAHAEVKLGNSMIMISEASEQYPPNPTMIHVYTEDVDAVYKKAMDAGAESLKEPGDQFYGDRSCMVRDTSGNSWGIATHIKDLTPEEIEKFPKSLSWDQRII